MPSTIRRGDQGDDVRLAQQRFVLLCLFEKARTPRLQIKHNENTVFSCEVNPWLDSLDWLLGRVVTVSTGHTVGDGHDDFEAGHNDGFVIC